MPPAFGRPRRPIPVAVLGLLAFGCAEPADGPLTVFAASSLTDAFGEMAEAFRATGEDVALAFGGSQALRLQIAHGAPADVFASANPDHVQALVESGDLTEARGFATNGLVVALPEGNPAQVTRFAELPRAERIVWGAPTVPAGAYARAIVDRAERRWPGFRAAIRARVVSEAPNVRLARAKVVLGEADAAFLYRTDAAGLPTVDIPDDLGVEVTYHHGLVRGRPRVDAARRWTTFVHSDAGQAILRRHGFGAPP